MKLFEMLPAYYQNSTETEDLQNAFDKEVQKAEAVKDDLLLQLNVRTATWGLNLWEKAYGIVPDAEKSVDFRRSRVESKMRSQGVTTVAMIQNAAESFSNGEVAVTEYPEEYRFDITFLGTLGIPPNMDDLTAVIEEIKPAHLGYGYVYIFVTYDQLKRFTYDELKMFTHIRIRNGRD